VCRSPHASRERIGDTRVVPAATADCLVIGGGFAGLSTALHLAWSGAKVRVVERGRVGDGTSSRASGWICAQLRSPNPLLALVLESLAYYPAFLARLGTDCGYAVSGSTVAFDSPEQLASRRTIDAEMRKVPAYEGTRFLDARELRELEPAFAERMVGGAFYARDAQVDPRLLLEAMHRAAVACGATVHEGAEVTELVRDGAEWRATTAMGDFTAPQVVNASGAWAGAISDQTGFELAVMPVSGQLLVTRPHPGVLRSCVIYQPDPRFETTLACGIRPAVDGRLWMGTTYRAGTYDVSITTADTQAILGAVASVFPSLVGLEIEQAWAGVRPVPTDLLPVYGRVSSIDGYHIAVPIAGLAEAAIIGKVVAAGVMGGDAGHPEVSPDRLLEAD